MRRLVGLLVLASLAPDWAAALEAPTLSNYQLVSSTRVSRTHFDFTYRASLSNTLPDGLSSVDATLKSASPATQVIDGTLRFGDVAEHSSATSQDTFTIRQDRTLPFEPAVLRWTVGVRLGGDPSARAAEALKTLPPVGADPGDVDEGIILTRVDVFLAADGTVGDVNAALDAVGARIVSMLPGGDAVTIAVPRRANFTELRTLAETLMTFRGIGHAVPGMQSQVTFVAAANDVATMGHLVAGRFPAAWNASSLVVGCQRTPLVIQDQFRSQPVGFASLFPGFPVVPPMLPVGDPHEDEHGYYVFAVAAAPLSLAKSPGTNPFINCVDPVPLQNTATTLVEEQEDMVLGFPPTGKFVLSHSMGFRSHCQRLDPVTHEFLLVNCTPALVDKWIVKPIDRARYAHNWKALTRARWPDFLVAVSAGNERNDGMGGVDIYPGLGKAANASALSAAALSDPLYGSASSASDWTPSSLLLGQGFASIAADAAEIAALRAEVHALGLDSVVADNVVVVGAVTELANALHGSREYKVLDEAKFSDTGPDVKAVGENVSLVCTPLACETASGNSYTAPQVAGLATYLWAVSPDLRNRPASVTRRAIVYNRRDDGNTLGILDAYAAVLSLDEVGLPDPATWLVRKAILDVNVGGPSAGSFDEADIAEFLNHFFFPVIEPTTPDFGRYDLNGDGFTGGSGKERFDLDRRGSFRFEESSYSTVLQDVEGNMLEFNEREVTDLDVLCFYAYSPLYEGDLTVRRQLLSQLPGNQRCVFSVKPNAVALSSGQQQQFQALGVPNGGAVTWTATGGTIDANTGLFTASSAGAVTVRATAVADPALFAEATVTVTGQRTVLFFAGGLSVSAGVGSPVVLGSPVTADSHQDNCQVGPGSGSCNRSVQAHVSPVGGGADFSASSAATISTSGSTASISGTLRSQVTASKVLTSANAGAGATASFSFQVTGTPATLSATTSGLNLPFTRANGGAVTIITLTGPEESGLQVELVGGPGSIVLPIDGDYSLTVGASTRANPVSPIPTDPNDPSTIVPVNLSVTNTFGVSVSIQ